MLSTPMVHSWLPLRSAQSVRCNCRLLLQRSTCHPKRRAPALPILTMGSIASTMPSRNRVPCPRVPKFGTVWILMQPRTDAWPTKYATTTEPVGFHVSLHCRTNVADCFSQPDFFDGLLQRRLRYIQKLLQLRRQRVAYRYP